MILKNVKAVFLSNILIQAIGFIASFVIKRFIAPSLMGVWNLVTIAVNYILMVNTGVGSAASRQLPYWAGRGDAERETKTQETFFFVVLVELLISTVIFYLVFLFKRDLFQSEVWYLFLLAPFYAFTIRIYNSFVVVFRAKQEFVRLSKQNIQFAVMNIVLAMAGAWLMGIAGYFIGIALFYSFRVYKMIQLTRKTGIKIRIRFHKDIFAELVKMGFPIEVGSYFYGFFITIDSILVTRWLGIGSLALYTVGANLAKQMGDFPTQVNTIIFPRIVNKFAMTHDLKQLSKEVYIFFIGNLLIIVPFLTLFIVFVGPWLIRSFIRNYLGAAEPLVITAFTMFFIPQIHLPFSMFLLKKQVWKTVAYNIFNFFVLSGVILLANHGSPSLQGVAASVVLGYFICFAVVFWDSMNGVLSTSEKIRVLAFQQASFWSCAALVFFLEMAFPSSMSRQQDTLNTAAKMAIAFSICAPVAYWVLIFTGTWEKVRDELMLTITNFRSRFASIPVDSGTEVK